VIWNDGGVRNMRLVPILAAVALTTAACGDSVEDRAVERDTPAITSPGTSIPYEQGGGDGSGADGSEAAQDRGGVAAGPDTPAPRDEPGGEAGSPSEGETAQ